MWVLGGLLSLHVVYISRSLFIKEKNIIIADPGNTLELKKELK